jgi:hypothetical protein
MGGEDGGGEDTTWWGSRERRHAQKRGQRECVFFTKMPLF